MTHPNVDPKEIDKFSTLSQQWWNKDGELKTLHDLNPLRVSFIQDKVNLQNLTVLDIGCGGGILSESLAKLGASVTGIDLSKEVIDVAISHASSSNLDIKYQCISLEELAEQHNQSFDVITCLELLEHVPHPENIIASCAKLIKPQGHLFFSTLNRTAMSYLLAIIGAEYLLKLIPRHTHDYDKFIRPSELTAWLRSANLTVKQIKGIKYNPFLRTAQFTSNLSINYIMHSQA